jgi:flagellar motor protein MotB
VAPNDTPENKLRNRRVEFKVLNMDALENPAPKD